jgi:hypothetical protein
MASASIRGNVWVSVTFPPKGSWYRKYTELTKPVAYLTIDERGHGSA